MTTTKIEEQAQEEAKATLKAASATSKAATEAVKATELTAKKAAEIAAAARAAKVGSPDPKAKAQTKLVQENAKVTEKPLETEHGYQGGNGFGWVSSSKFGRQSWRERLAQKRAGEKIINDKGEAEFLYPYKELEPGENPGWSQRMNSANDLVASLMRVSYSFGNRNLKTGDKETDLKITRVLETTFHPGFRSGDDEPAFGYGIDRLFLLKAYADFLKQTLSKSEQLLVTNGMLGALAPFSMAYRRNQTLTDIIGTNDLQGLGRGNEELDFVRKQEGTAQSELGREIEALSYAERNQLIPSDVYRYLMGASGMVQNYAHYSPDTRTTGEMFDIPHSELSKTKVSMGSLTVLRAIIGNRRRFVNLWSNLRMNCGVILGNALDLATMEMYPRLKPGNQIVTMPETFQGIFGYPHLGEYHSAAAAVESMSNFVAELRKEYDASKDFMG